MANIVLPSSSPSLSRPPPPPSSSSCSSSSLSLCSSKPNPRRAQNPNNVLFLASQTSTVLPLEHVSLRQEPLFAPELFGEPCFVEYDVVGDLFGSLRASARLGDASLAKAIHACAVKLSSDDGRFGCSLISAYLKLGLVSEARKVFSGMDQPDLAAYAAMISGLAKSSREIEALELFLEMRRAGIEPNDFGFVAVLTACIQALEIQLGFQIHALAIKTGCLECVFVANALMSLYGKCRLFELVGQLFDQMPHRDIVSWNTAMSCAAKEGPPGKALGLFRGMRGSGYGFGVDKFMISTLLSACGCSGALEQGLEIHGLTIKSGLEGNLSVGNALIGFYTKCGSIKDVEALFEEMPVRDAITWTEMITAYMDSGLVNSAVEIFERMPEWNSFSYNSLLAGFCKNGEGLKALEFFIGMISHCVELTDYALTSVVDACGLVGDTEISRQIHGFVVKSGCGSNNFVDSALLDMYTRCGRMSDANKMLLQNPPDQKNRSIMLTSMICGYARNGKLEEAISLFHDSQMEGTMILDGVALTSVLSLCGSIAFHEMGKQIHCLTLKSGFLADLEVANAVVSMYAKCWNMDDAIKSFNSMANRDVVSWNGLISGHLIHRRGDEVLAVWSEMEKTGLKPDNVTFTLVISAYRHTSSNLVNDCRTLFHSLKSNYNTEPTSDHIASFVGVLGYWGLFEEAEQMLNDLRFEPDVSVWRALLDSSRLRLNTKVGKMAARRILAIGPRDPSSYILISNLYSASGRWHCSRRVREEMREKGLKKQPGQSWIVHDHKIYSFYARDKSHFQAKDIYSGLEILIRECLKSGYVPDTSFVLHEVEEQQKRDFLFYHSAKLATAFGVLMAKPGKPVRIVKNMALCGDCHAFLKHVSLVTNRDIFLRDTSGFHCFSRGNCSCKDYW